MLRNTGINVTERKIRQDTQRAYEYDCCHECPRRSRDAGYFDRDVYSAGFKAHMRRQPRYNYTIPRHIPIYARSSISSCIRHSELDRVKMIYLPEKDWSAESPYLIPEPRYREKSYSNHKSYHINEVERPLRRNLRYNAESSPRRTSSVCFEENKMERIIDATKYIIDNYCPKRDSSKYRNPVRKVTRKLSPIRTLDCNTSCMIQQPKNSKYTTNFDNPIRTHTKPKSNNVSKEPRKMSLDIHKILSLLQKADVEEEEQYSLESLLQKVHSLECFSTNNVNHRKTELITERVQIFPNMEKKAQDPITKFKNVLGVRSKLEALVNLLKQYEDEKALTDSPAVGSSKKDVVTKYESPTQEVRSFLNEKGVKSTNDEAKEHIGQKDIVLQTEEPKTSNKSICGEIDTNNSIEERKFLKSRFSWKGKENTEFKKCKDRKEEKQSVKELERNKLSHFKKISKDKTYSEKTMASKQHLTNNCHEAKTGLMITIGGKVFRKKLANSEKRHEKMSHTWLKRYLESKKDTKDNDIHHRWNNRAYYTKSSSTVMELINNVYNQMGMNLKSKMDDVSRNPYILKSSRRNGHKSPRKTRYRQRLEAYMMPQMVTHGPVYMSDKIPYADINHVTKSIGKLMSNTKLPFEQKNYLQNKCSMNSKVVKMTNDPSSIFFRIYMAKDYFNTVSISNQELRNSTSDERVCKITEYEATQSQIFNNSFTENLCQEMRSVAHHKKNDDVHRDAIVQVSYANSGFLKKCGVGTTIVSKQGPEIETTKSEYQMQELVDEKTSSKTSRALAEQALQDCRSLPAPFDSKSSAHKGWDKIKVGHQSVEKYKVANIYNQDFRIQSSKSSSPTQDQDMLCSKEFEDITLPLTVPGKNTKTKTKNRVVTKYKVNLKVNKRRKFYTSRKSKRFSRIKPIVIIRWNNHIETSRLSSGRQFKIDKCTYFCSETDNKSKAEDQSPLQIKNTQYPYKIQYPYVHQIPYQQTFPIPQLPLQFPQYLPQPLCAPQLSCQTQYPEPLYIKIPQEPYEPQPLPQSNYQLGPSLTSEVQYAPQTIFDSQNTPNTQNTLKCETKFEPPYAHQNLYAHIAEPIFDLKYPPQVKYLPRVELKPGLQPTTGASFLIRSQHEVGTPQVQYPYGIQCVPEAQVRKIYRPPMQYPSEAKLQPEILKANKKLESKHPYMKPSVLLLSSKVDNLKAKKEVDFEAKITPKKTSEVLIVKLKKLNAREQSQSKILFESKELAGLTQTQTKYPPVIFKGNQPNKNLKLDKSQQVIRLSSADLPSFKLQPPHYLYEDQVPCLQSTGLQYCEHNSLTSSQSYTQYLRPIEPRESYQSQISVCFINTKYVTSKQNLMHKKSSKSKILTKSSQGTKLRLTKTNKVNHKMQGITETRRRCKDGIGFHLKIFPFNNITLIQSRSKEKRVSKELNHHKHCHKCKRGREKRTGGGIVIDINMNGDGDPHRMNNLKSTYQQTSQENTIEKRAEEQIVQPTIQLLNDFIKINFGINIVNSREFRISKNLTDPLISDGFSENVSNEFNKVAEKNSGLMFYASNSSNQNYSNSSHQISRQCYSRATSPLNEESRYNSIEGCVVKSTMKRTNNRLKNNVFQAGKNSSLENFNVIEDYVNHLLGPIGAIKQNNLKWVKETKSMLEAIKTMNASGDMTLTDIKVNNNLSNLSIKLKKSKCREIVNKLSKIRQIYKKNKLLKDQTHTNKENPDVKSKTSRFSSMCNSVARNLNMSTINKLQHKKVDKKTSCYIRTDRDHVACGVSNFEIRDIQRHSPVTSTAPAASLENNTNAVDRKTVVGKHDTNKIGTACVIACKSSKRDKLLTKVKHTFSHYVKNMKKNSEKKNEKSKAKMNKNDTILLANVTPHKCQDNSYLHKEIPVMNYDNSVKMNTNPMDDTFYETDQAEILQSYIVKKAVLQIYTDESITHTDYLVAKIPKYLFL